MGYYKQIQMMNKSLESFIQRHKNTGATFDELEYYLTNKFEVSANAIRKRLDLLVRLGKVKFENITKDESLGAYIWVT